jgi:hypothetical protein
VKKEIYRQSKGKNYSPDTVRRFRADTKIKIITDNEDPFDPFIVWEDTPFNNDIKNVIRSQKWDMPTAI